MGVKEDRYFSHQPIYGYLRGPTEGRDLIRYARILSILKDIATFSFTNFIDIGGAEGYTANLVKKIFNVESYSCDLSSEANFRAQELFGLDSAGIDLSNLPFEDGAFDIVLCSEVLEHVTNPIQAICELKRITKKALIITTEAICYDKLERRLRMLLVDVKENHADRNWYLIDDFSVLLGKEISHKNTIPAFSLFNRKGYAIDEVVRILRTCDNRGRFERGGIGASIIYAKEIPENKEKMDADILIDAILNTTADIEYAKNIKQNKPRDENWYSMLRCPKCLGLIIKENDSMICQECGNRYNIERGVPLMYTSGEDNMYLFKKWETIYKDTYNQGSKDLIALKALFGQKGTSFAIRFMAGFVLKLKERIEYLSKLTIERSPGYILSNLLHDTKKKLLRETRRVINKLRRLKATDLQIGDIVEFVNDYKMPGKDDVLVRKGGMGKISVILDDRINIKIEGIDEFISLLAKPGSCQNELAYVKKPLDELD